MLIFRSVIIVITLPETNIFAPESGWLEYVRFLLGRHKRIVSTPPKSNSEFTPKNGWLKDDPASFLGGLNAYFQGQTRC